MSIELRYYLRWLETGEHLQRVVETFGSLARLFIPRKLLLTAPQALATLTAREGRGMADLRIERFPEDLLRELKVKAAQEDTTVKALMILAAEKLLGKKTAK